MSDNSRARPVLDLVSALVSAIEDGAVDAVEAQAIFETLATVVDHLALGVDRWALRWALRAGAAALREAADHVEDLPGWQWEHPDQETRR